MKKSKSSRVSHVERHNRELLKLAQSGAIDSGNFSAAAKLITESLSSALQVERASLWLYSADQSSIICADLYERDSDKHSSGLELRAADFPAYFNYLLEERTLPAHDVYTNPATVEFSDVYLKPLNIFSMLDAPIRLNGRMVGVICSEQIGKPRCWTLEDETFAGNVTDIVARALQAELRANALKKLEEMNHNLERLVEERSRQLEEQRAQTMNSAKMAALGEMAGGVAHEINTPLGAIILRSQQLGEMLSEGDVDLEFALQVTTEIENTCDRIARIVKGLRFFARDASLDGQASVKLNQIVEDTVAFCGERLRSHGCRLEVSITPPDVELHCQAVSVSQALLNLLNNAYDAVSTF